VKGLVVADSTVVGLRTGLASHGNPSHALSVDSSLSKRAGALVANPDSMCLEPGAQTTMEGAATLAASSQACVYVVMERCWHSIWSLE
jgi:hypothetical protein